jgi:hypothetical protein
MTAETRPRFKPSSLLGVYRFRDLVGGCPAWYAVDSLGAIADFLVVRPGLSEKQIVDDLARRIYGKNGPGARLTLVHARRASSAQLALLARAVPARPPASPAVLLGR